MFQGTPAVPSRCFRSQVMVRLGSSEVHVEEGGKGLHHLRRSLNCLPHYAYDNTVRCMPSYPAYHSTDLVTIIGRVTGSSPGKSRCALGGVGEDRHTPTAPSEYIASLWNKVYGLPVMKGVDVPTKPNFHKYEVSALSSCPWQLAVDLPPTFVALVYLFSALLRPSGAPSLRYKTLVTDSGLFFKVVSARWMKG